MKVVIAIDSFKGSMSSIEAGNAAAEGIRNARECQSVVKPLADGGEGTTEALVEGLGGTMINVEVTGPLGQATTAKYGILEDGCAVMEMAEASGIILVDRHDLNPWKATTIGVGQMIMDAVSKGVREFIIGIGGSATTEGGIGMLSSLGYKFLDAEGKELPVEFASLGKVCTIDGSQVPKELDECHFQIACDVKNPLCGTSGAVYVFGPQKGVKEDERQQMDDMMKNYAQAAAGYTGKDMAELQGAGAAGGLGFAFASFFANAELKPGIDIVLNAIELEKELADADVVITGEGRLDSQTAMGKVPIGVAKLAKNYGCKVIAFAGGVTDDAGKNNAEGIDAFFPIVRGVCTLDEAMNPDRAKMNMTMAVEQVFRLL